jgi:hypothetical protein
VTTQGPEGAAGGAGPGGAGPGGGPAGGAPPTDEELRAALEEQMRRLTVSDVLVQTVVTLVNLGARRLGLTAPPGEAPAEGERDLEQGRLAIDATRALLPLVPGEVAAIRDALSQLQVAFARATQEHGGEEAEAGAGAPPGAAPAPGEEAGEPSPATGEQPPPPGDPERQRARSKIWTPPGS